MLWGASRRIGKRQLTGSRYRLGMGHYGREMTQSYYEKGLAEGEVRSKWEGKLEAKRKY